MTLTYDVILNRLRNDGYVVIPNIITDNEIQTALRYFNIWKSSLKNYEWTIPHGIFKFHEVGHQRHAWYLRTRSSIQDVFRFIWNTDDIITSFDGSCYIPKSLSKKDTNWTHTDQAPISKGLKCYQSFVSLTDNRERTLVVYKGSHLLHENYFKSKGITSPKNWHKIDTEYLHSIQHLRRVLYVPKGSLVLWDSRTFHQNQYGAPESEQRIVQYICFLPKNHKDNSLSMQKKRKKYFDEKRTTSHWPYPISVNGLQPQTYGDKTKEIDYSQLPKIDVSDMQRDINAIL